MVTLVRRFIDYRERKYQYKQAVARKPVYDLLVPLERQKQECGYCTLVPPVPRNLCSDHLIQYFK